MNEERVRGDQLKIITPRPPMMNEWNVTCTGAADILQKCQETRVAVARFLNAAVLDTEVTAE